MSLRVGVQMDPIERVRIGGDTTFLLALEAHARGHRLFYWLPDALSLESGRAFTRAAPLELREVEGDHFTLGEAQVEEVGAFDVVLLRQDPPFDMHYVTTTHILETVHPATLVVNDPVEVRNAPEKLFVTRWPELQPPTLITRDVAAMDAFRARHGDVVLKPLYGGAGSGVVRLKADDPNMTAMLELYAAASREQLVMQGFLPSVVEGDKRVLIVDGEPVGAINRVPAKGQIRSNLAVGGRAEAVELTARDRESCATIGPELKRRGLIFVGIDVIGGWLTEINVTSPTGARQLKAFGGADAAAALWDAVEARRAGG